jgi:hypothetical protein
MSLTNKFQGGEKNDENELDPSASNILRGFDRRGSGSGMAP